MSTPMKKFLQKQLSTPVKSEQKQNPSQIGSSPFKQKLGFSAQKLNIPMMMGSEGDKKGKDGKQMLIEEFLIDDEDQEMKEESKYGSDQKRREEKGIKPTKNGAKKAAQDKKKKSYRYKQRSYSPISLQNDEPSSSRS